FSLPLSCSPRPRCAFPTRRSADLNSPAALFSKEKVEYVVAARIPMLEKTAPLNKRLDIALRSIQIMVKNQEETLSDNIDLNYFLDVKLPGTFEFGDSKPIVQAGKE